MGKKNLFKTIRNSINSKEQVLQLIRSLNDTADYFLAIQNPEDELWKDKPEIKLALKELKLFQIKQTYSLFLAALRNLELDKLKKLAKICSVISFRYNIISGLNPKAQEDVYNSIALKIAGTNNFEVNDFASIYINDMQFENAFTNKELKNTTRNLKIVKYILLKIEIYLHRNDIDTESDVFTIKHILPQSAHEHWGEFTYEEMNRSIYRMGNLTLLEKKLNQEAEQKPYTDKLNIYRRSNSKLTQEIAERYHSWNESRIASRQKELAKHAKSV